MITEHGEILNEPLAYTITWKTPFNHDTTTEALRVALFCTGESKTQQHGKEEADINTIVNRFLKTGLMPQVKIPPSYQDFEGIFDFQDAMNVVAAGKHAFMQMPADIRDAFHNSPERFVDTINGMLGEEDSQKREKNLEVLRAMNLAVTPGAPADKTTLGDVLKAIKEQGTPNPPTGGTPLKGAS